MDIDIEKNKQEFNELLRSVGREGTLKHALPLGLRWR